ncbi:MAG: hypothetical protein ACOXZR_04190 [Bacilli bacterium]
MNNKKQVKLTLSEVKETVNKINGSMAQEGMPLTKEIKKNIEKCLIGESTTQEESQKAIERYKQIYG